MLYDLFTPTVIYKFVTTAALRAADQAPSRIPGFDAAKAKAQLEHEFLPFKVGEATATATAEARLASGLPGIEERREPTDEECDILREIVEQETDRLIEIIRNAG